MMWKSRQSPRSRPRLTAVAILLVVVAGCSSSAETSGEKESQGGDSAQSKTSSESGESASAKPSKELGDPVASRNGSTSEGDARLDMYAISRSEKLITINFSLTLSADAQETFQVADYFTDDNYDASDGEGDAVDGVQVLDTENAKLHLVASDGAKHCVCSRGLSSTFIEPGKAVLFTAAYGAPPEDVSAVDVQVPHFGTISDVPVK